MAAITFGLNGKPQTVDVVPQMPLLWVLRDTLGMTGTKFGCGMALCGACTVHLNGQAIRSCSHARFAASRARASPPSKGSPPMAAIPVQRAWIEGDVPQCGYCQSGQIMAAAALLAKKRTAHRRRYRRSHARQHLPLRHLSGYSPRHPSRGRDCREVRNDTLESPRLSQDERRRRGRTAGRFLSARELEARGADTPTDPQS